MDANSLFHAKLAAELRSDHLLKVGPKIVTRDQFIKDARETHESLSNTPFTMPDRVPDIQVIWESSNDGYATVTVELWDIGDDKDEKRTYDAHFTVSNNDNVGPIAMLGQLQRCVEQFYAMGLNTQFGRVIGDV